MSGDSDGVGSMDFTFLEAGKRSYETVSKNAGQPRQKSHNSICYSFDISLEFSFSSAIIKEVILKESKSHTLIWVGNSVFVLLSG